MKNVKLFFEWLPKWTLTGVCLAVILWLTLAAKPLGDNDLPLFPGADKVVHAIMFGGFTFCIIMDRMRKDGWRRCTIKMAATAAIASIMLGVLTEIGQEAMHIGRSGDLLDLASDAAGAVLVAALFL